MLSALLIAVVPCSLGMVIDYPAFDKPQTQTKGSMMIQFDGELHRINEEIGCSECCTTTFMERNVSWQHAQNHSLYVQSGGLNVLDTWNHETEAEFAKCGAMTTENVVTSSNEQLFTSWGMLLAGDHMHGYCASACNGSMKAMTILHESILQPLMKSQMEAVGNMTSDIAHDVAQDKTGHAALEYKGGCSDGCYTGSHYKKIRWLGTHGAKGSMCLTSSQGTMKISRAKGAARDLKGTCNSLAFSGFSSGGHISGGTGSCGVMTYIMHTECIGTDQVRAYLNRSPNQVIVTRTSGLLQLSEYAADEKMSIDQLLDHPEHGQHAQNLLLDFYKDSLEAGEPLIEMSRRDAQKHEHSLILEDRHLEKAMSLHSQLPEVWKKRNFVPVGYRLVARRT